MSFTFKEYIGGSLSSEVTTDTMDEFLQMIRLMYEDAATDQVPRLNHRGMPRSRQIVINLPIKASALFEAQERRVVRYDLLSRSEFKALERKLKAEAQAIRPAETHSPPALPDPPPNSTPGTGTD